MYTSNEKTRQYFWNRTKNFGTGQYYLDKDNIIWARTIFFGSGQYILDPAIWPICKNTCLSVLKILTTFEVYYIECIIIFDTSRGHYNLYSNEVVYNFHVLNAMLCSRRISTRALLLNKGPVV